LVWFGKRVSHGQSGWETAPTTMSRHAYIMLQDLCTLKRRERRAPVHGFKGANFPARSSPTVNENKIGCAEVSRVLKFVHLDLYVHES
jgi:hypothetical protein